MKTKNLFLAIIVSLITFCAYSQQNCTYQKNNITFAKHHSVNVASIKKDWNVRLLNLDKLFEGNSQYEKFMEQVKVESAKKFPKKNPLGNDTKSSAKNSPDTCVILKSFEGNLFGNNVPNDNTLAVSNSGMLVSDINCNIITYDTQNDTLLKTVSLSAFSDSLDLFSEQYDPKLLYDPSADKFVMAYLAGYTDSTSNIILAFSETSDPLGLWNMYYLPGNPLSDTSWSDFPAIGLTQNELFLTINLLQDSGTWQTSFKQSVIWQIDKYRGYAGDSLKTKLWSHITSDGKQIRNIHPVQGGSALAGPDIYLLSDRNFAIQSDTIFLMHITDVLTNSNASLNITPLVSDKCYGMPPNADQPSNQTFATNDARVLGGFMENDKIQFVGNTIDTLTGKAAIFHGIISNLQTAPSVHLTLLSDTIEYGYPNISYTGATSTDNSAIISVNYSGKYNFPGYCAFNYNGTTGVYSSRGLLKSGNTGVNFFSGTDAERWGDYSGSQRVYNQPGKVWVSGNFGKKVNSFTRVNATWIAQLQKAAPDAGVADYSGLNSKTSLNVFPNPVSGLMFVDLNIPYDANINVTLYDETGKMVKLLLHGRATEGKNLLSFNTNPLSPGIYFLKVNDASNIFLTKKIVKE